MAEVPKLGITGTPAFLIGWTEPNGSRLTTLAAGAAEASRDRATTWL